MKDEKAFPKVFISYAHEGNLGDDVERLATWLTENGVTVITDHPYKNHPPEKGWHTWMQHSIEDADIVLMVCTELYKRRFEKRDEDPGKGQGVIWEAAIVTTDLYESKLSNTRFFPILPDGGNPAHIPSVLKAFDNRHFFTSGNGRILSLIKDEIVVPKPSHPLRKHLPGELLDGNDPRIQPREGFFLGREDELLEVLGFLNGTKHSNAVCSHLTGTAGIGKTEVCKAALKRWISGECASRVFWIQVGDNAQSQELIAQLADAIGLSSDKIADVLTLSHLRSYLPQGLYYLDNLESIAESTDGRKFLRELSQIPGIRILASSRVSLEHVFGQSIVIPHLDLDSATTLFQRCWTGDQKDWDEIALKAFVKNKLGCHPLTISLIARLGRAYGWSRIQELWNEQGTLMAQARKASDRSDSLEISFSLAARLLNEEAGALDLWQFIALFPTPFHESMLSSWEKISGCSNARIALSDHSLFSITGHMVSMLPPISRYALSQARLERASELYFNWERARDLAYHYFVALSRNASDIASSEIAITSRDICARQLWAVEQLIKTDLAFDHPNRELAKRLHHQLQNVYTFNALAGDALLKHFQKMLGDALSLRTLGDLESRLGKVDEALAHYNRAIELYTDERANLGLANVHQSFGDLQQQNHAYKEAVRQYQMAIPLYESEKDAMGYAYTLAEIIKCVHKSDGWILEELKPISTRALNAANQCGVKSVVEYVRNALLEVFAQDTDKLNDFLEP